MYIILVKCLWKNVKVDLYGKDVPVGGSPDGSVGYCPIYDTLEEAEKEWPGHHTLEIKTTTPK
jgi:hypothetical protein